MTRFLLRTAVFTAMVSGLVPGVAFGATPPARLAPTPSERQLAWHDIEFYGMIHFGLNTFTDKEWGYGDVSPTVFNPEGLDANRIAKSFSEAGMRGLILICKHHDGFCLWPSAYTDYSVKRSPWRNGKGDLVKELSEACHANGLKFGVYLSPWDRNRKDYGQPEYVTYYRQQLSELLTNYGDIFMTWHDGANGGDGYYGGAREKRVIDNRTYYDWPETWGLVRKWQPMAAIFSDAGPDVRWVGNENGVAGDPCWCTRDLKGCYPGMPESEGNINGHRDGPDWVPAECDVSIRPRWFHHERDNGRVKSADQLVELYFKSVGRSAALDLNVPLNMQGQIDPVDQKSLTGLRQRLDAIFATNLVAGATIEPSNVRGNSKEFRPENLLDENRKTYWATDDEATAPTLIFKLKYTAVFNVARLREYLPLGQRVDIFGLDAWIDGQWREIYRGAGIGSQHLARFPRIETDRLRLRIVKAAGCPALSEFGLFFDPVEQSLGARKR